MIEILDAVFVYQMKNAEDIQWHTRYHRHQEREFELHYFIGGEGQFRIGKTLRALRPGALFICPPHCDHAVVAGDEDHPISYYAALFTLSPDSRELETILHEISAHSPKIIGRNYRFFFEEIKERIGSELNSRRMAAVHQLLSFIYLMSEGDVPEGEPGNIHLEKAMDLMQEKVYESLRLSDVSRRMGITESYLIRLFRKKLNITPMKYYTRLKVEAGAAMLLDTSMAVYEIADRLKFYSEYHFSRVFKQYTGSAPTVYRNQQYHGGKRVALR